MTRTSFVHLGARSEASAGESIARVEELCWEASRDEQGYLGLADVNSLARVPAFAMAAGRAGLRPLYGAEASVLPRGEPHYRGTTYRLRLLVESEIGWRNLVRIVNEARRRESAARPPHLPLQSLLGDARGLLVLTGGPASELYHAVGEGEFEAVHPLVGGLIDAVGRDRVFVELPAPRGEAGEIARALDTIAGHYNLLSVAVPEVCCAHPADDAVFRFYSGDVPSAKGRAALKKLVRPFDDRRHLVSRSIAACLYTDYPHALDTALAIAQHCSAFALPQVQNRFPMHNFGRGVDAESYIWNTAFAGATQRYGDLPTRYKERLNVEFREIVEAGLANAIVSLVRLNEELERDGVQRGPGAGLLTNSVIASLLGLTQLDPLKFDLPFELPAGLGKGAFPLLELSIPANQNGAAVKALERLFDGQAAPVGEWRGWKAGTCLERAAEVLGKDGRWAAATAKEPAFLRARKEASKQPAAWMPDENAALESAEVLGWLVQRMEGRAREIVPDGGVYTFSVEQIGMSLPQRVLPVEDSVQAGLSVSEWTSGELGRLRYGRIAFVYAPLLDLIGESTELVRQQGDFRYSPQETTAGDAPTYRLLREGSTAGIAPLEAPSIRARLRKGQPMDLHALIRLLKPGTDSPGNAPLPDIGTILLCHVAASIKAHRPLAFFAAALSQASGDTRRTMLLLDEANHRGIDIADLDINYSGWHWSVERDAIRPGFIAVRGMSESAGMEIVSKRREMHFADLADLCRRTEKGRLKPRHLRALLDGGAFDALSSSRQEARKQLDALFPVITSRRSHGASGNDELAFFDRDGSWWIREYGQAQASGENVEHPLALQAQQNAALGFTLREIATEKELDYYHDARVYTPAKLNLKMAGQTVALTGIAGPAEEADDALGGVLIDIGGVLVRSRGPEGRRLLAPDLAGRRVIAAGRIDRDPFQWHLDLAALATANEALNRAVSTAAIRIDTSEMPEAEMKKLLALLKRFPGRTPLRMDYHPVNPSRLFRAIASRRVLVCPLLELGLDELFGKGGWAREEEEQAAPPHESFIEASARLSSRTIRKMKTMIGA